MCFTVPATSRTPVFANAGLVCWKYFGRAGTVLGVAGVKQNQKAGASDVDLQHKY